MIVCNSVASKEMEKMVPIQYILGDKLDRVADGLNIGDKEKQQSRRMPKFLSCRTTWMMTPSLR